MSNNERMKYMLISKQELYESVWRNHLRTFAYINELDYEALQATIHKYGIPLPNRKQLEQHILTPPTKFISLDDSSLLISLKEEPPLDRTVDDLYFLNLYPLDIRDQIITSYYYLQSINLKSKTLQKRHFFFTDTKIKPLLSNLKIDILLFTEYLLLFKILCTHLQKANFKVSIKNNILYCELEDYKIEITLSTLSSSETTEDIVEVHLSGFCKYVPTIEIGKSIKIHFNKQFFLLELFLTILKFPESLILEEYRLTKHNSLLSQKLKSYVNPYPKQPLFHFDTFKQLIIAYKNANIQTSFLEWLQTTNATYLIPRDTAFQLYKQLFHANYQPTEFITKRQYYELIKILVGASL
ncbi:hypothetical protein MT340_002145 [Staphylococcus sp. NRL 16/872]|uniref:hypothetical protein n=1 Tax=Staphylococcus sp. NRL 16/872 TaxID=2930131 RepID=UPI0024DE25EA|nr:hypothetical protein [Staphylococcus sp. NRL 16/872]WEN69773.1 hypothetical protein MT340_002145 [Staphylococcus sp. NRL 16/872]